MSSSTLPKSVQAEASDGGQDLGGSSGSSPQDRRENYREFVEKIKQLPDDFLRIPASCYQQVDLANLAQVPRAILSRDAPLVDMIDISVVEAQLVKNYGLLRMDLYCKIRVGHMVCETQTCVNGAKNPKWDGVYQFSLKPGIDSFHLEIYDEKQFSLDEKIAWLHEPIPPEIFQGITVERWFPLTGRLGPNKEGSVLLVISHKRVPMRASNFGRALSPSQTGAPMTVFVPAANHAPIISGPAGMIPGNPPVGQIHFVQPNPQPPAPASLPAQPPSAEAAYEQQRQPQYQQQHQARANVADVGPPSEEDVNQLSEMFPSIDKAIIKAILENNHNDKEAAIGALLALG